jgi:hypothetical protein
LIIDRAKTRWRPKGKRVKGVIYDPNNEVLREVTWTSTGDEGDPLDHDRPSDEPESRP